MYGMHFSSSALAQTGSDLEMHNKVHLGKQVFVVHKLCIFNNKQNGAPNFPKY